MSNESPKLGNAERIPSYPLLSKAIDDYEEYSSETVHIKEGNYDGVPCILVNSRIFPKAAGDKAISEIVSSWQGGSSTWYDKYREMVVASPLKDKLVARYGDGVLNDFPTHHAGGVLGGFQEN